LTTSSGTILVIEDNDDSRELLALILSGEGLAVAEACSGDEGLSKAKELIPSLVVLDLTLPVMDGLSVARELRACDTTCKIPLVLMTGHVLDPRETEIFDHVITKPADFRHLVSLVKQASGLH
jgi:CheY-like chemotaxis protein